MMSGTLQHYLRYWAAPFAIDLRTLALFRVCFGLVFLADLVIRASTVTAHYTDDGVWPRADAAAALPELGFSFHLLGGSTGFQLVLFAVAGLLALLLTVGYRTRLMTILCWVMLASINHRNYLIGQTSDTLMLSLLFWSIFLPLGARYSVDAALNQNTIESNSICSWATAAMVVQVLSVYFFGALLKTGDVWMVSDDAIHVALHFSAYASQLGLWMGETLPLAVQKILTQYTWYIELYGPVLVLLPFLTQQIRFVVIPMLMVLHVGFALLLTVGIYPYLSITSLILLIPSRFWEFIHGRLSTPERLGLKIYYDGPCAFCKKTCLLLRTFLLLDSTPIEPAQDRPEILELLQMHNSWVVEDFDGQRYVHWSAMILVFRRSWLLGPIAGLFNVKPLRVLGDGFYQWVTAHRDRLGTVSSIALPYRSFDTRLPLLPNLAAGGLMFIVIFSNAAKLERLNLEFPWTLQRLTVALMLNQHWSMFAPEPGRTTLWLFVEGLTKDEAKVDVYADSRVPPKISRPQNPSGHFDGYRWRKYFNVGNVHERWPKLSTFYCRQWNNKHPDISVERVKGYILVEQTRLGIHPGDSQWERFVRPLSTRACEPK